MIPAWAWFVVAGGFAILGVFEILNGFGFSSEDDNNPDSAKSDHSERHAIEAYTVALLWGIIALLCAVEGAVRVLSGGYEK